jgi:uncharacterized protein YecT (DUF1311 family)
MKKYCSVIFALLLFTSCSNAPENKGDIRVELPPKPSQQENTASSKDADTNNQENYYNSYFGQYQIAEEGFSQHIKNNVVDKSYQTESLKLQQSSKSTTRDWLDLESNYVEIWDKELNNIYTKLINKLNDKQKEKLRNAQKGWVQFHINETELVKESWDDFGLGSQGHVELIMSAKDRLRIRTLQLMEYYYMLGGEIKFLYK